MHKNIDIIMSILRKRYNYDKNSTEPFKLSRSGIESYVRCPRCFYLDKKLGIRQPSMPGFTLNSAVDTLLKKEFDHFRTKKQPHPIMKLAKKDLIPFSHPDLDQWRNNFHGAQHIDTKNNFLIYGAVDDLWVDKSGMIYVVDYKATSTSAEINLEGPYKEGYKRQMEVYQWLMRKNGFKVSDTGYFVYCNGIKDNDFFDKKLDFDITLLPYTGSDKWVQGTIDKMKKLLDSDKIPKYSEDCEHCEYQKETNRVK